MTIFNPFGRIDASGAGLATQAASPSGLIQAGPDSPAGARDQQPVSAGGTTAAPRVNDG
ncbi:hypothetical protein [Mycobacterium sp.]|uniref:hypothetical protein n=1 Tax=Mycobacterium sp. TaxID=1785 RepID=UPI002BAF8606|nr:hypothetical protein [Mycobacterium sp.]HTQ21419.1 hypothetical protein [Mycobacterium sp.]